MCADIVPRDPIRDGVPISPSDLAWLCFDLVFLLGMEVENTLYIGIQVIWLVG